jgi:hypothetical protein
VSDKKSETRVTRFFSKKCKNYKQVVYSRKLNDRVVDYIDQARQGGITICRDGKRRKEKESEMGNLLRSGTAGII